MIVSEQRRPADVRPVAIRRAALASALAVFSCAHFGDEPPWADR